MCLLFFEAAAANQVVVSVWKIARSGNSETTRNKIRQKSPSVFTDASLGAEAAAFLRATQQSCALLEAIR